MDGDIVVYGEEGRVWYRASRLGTACDKVLIAARLGYTEIATTNEKMLAVYERGHAAEELVFARMKEDGWVTWGREETVELSVTGKIGVRGHIDGKGVPGNTDDRYLVEVKSQSDAEWKNYARDGWDSGFFPGYKWQVSTYMHATELPLALVRLNVATGEMKVEFYDEPWYSVDQIRKRLIDVERAARLGELGECTGRVWPCPFPYLDDGYGDKRETVDTEKDAEIDAVAKLFKQAERDRKVAQEQYDRSKSRAVEALGVGRYETSTGIKVTTWEQASGAPRLSAEDEKILTWMLWWFLGIDLNAYKRQAKGMRMSVTLPRGVGDG